jgi:hypothetical protein
MMSVGQVTVLPKYAISNIGYRVSIRYTAGIALAESDADHPVSCRVTVATKHRSHPIQANNLHCQDQV